MLRIPKTPKIQQQGGNHYQLPIQPIDFITRNKIPFVEGTAIKYITRHQAKNGAEDILKAMSCLEYILQDQYTAEVVHTSVTVSSEPPKEERTSSLNVPTILEAIEHSQEGEALHKLLSLLTYSDCDFKTVYSYGRGGAWAAAQVAYALDCPLVIVAEVEELKNTADMEGTCIFIDDIYDTGKTCGKVKNYAPWVVTGTLFVRGEVTADLDFVGTTLHNQKYIDMPISQMVDIEKKKEIS